MHRRLVDTHSKQLIHNESTSCGLQFLNYRPHFPQNLECDGSSTYRQHSSKSLLTHLLHREETADPRDDPFRTSHTSSDKFENSHLGLHHVLTYDWTVCNVLNTKYTSPREQTLQFRHLYFGECQRFHPCLLLKLERLVPTNPHAKN